MAPQYLNGGYGLVAGLLAALPSVAGHVTHVSHDKLHMARRGNFLNYRDTASDVTFSGLAMFPDDGSLSELGLSSACESALYQKVNCDDETSSLMTSQYIDGFGNSSVTSSVCSSVCGASIAQLHKNVSTACGEAAEMVPGLSYLGLVDLFWSNWNQSCFTDPSTGKNCNDVIAAFPNVDRLSSLPRSDLCSHCNVNKYARMQADAYSGVYEENWQSSYKYVAKACNITVHDFKPTTSAFNVTADSTTDNCVSGKTYTAKKGDTCDSIAKAKEVSAATMYYMNPSILDCADIAAGTKLCLPLKCKTQYKVQEKDTCVSIAAAAGIPTDQLLAYNSQLMWDCANLHAGESPSWGSTLCVSPPGGTYAGRPLNVSTTEVVEVADVPAGATVADGTTRDCGEWYTHDGSQTCAQVCIANLMSINLFIEANPSLSKATCDKDLVKGAAYCLDPLTGWNWAGKSTATVTSKGAAATKSTTVTATKSITAVTTKPTASAPTTSTTGAFTTGTSTAVTTKSTAPAATTATTEDSTTEASTTEVSTTEASTTEASTTETSATEVSTTEASTTETSATETSTTEASTTEASTTEASTTETSATEASATKASTTGTPTAASTTTTSTAASGTSAAASKTASGVPIPSPTQPGTIEGCTKYYFVETGDSCWAISQKYAISLDDFYKWNTKVGSQCGTLWLNYYVCVGV